MIGSKAYQKRQAKARLRRRLTAQERIARDRRQAQQAAQVLEQALHDLGIPHNLVIEIEGRIRLGWGKTPWRPRSRPRLSPPPSPSPIEGL